MGSNSQLNSNSYATRNYEDFTCVSSIESRVALLEQGSMGGIPTALDDYYIRNDGSNSNDGSENNAANAFQTLEYALNFLRTVSGMGKIVTLNCEDGTYELPGDIEGLEGFEKIIVTSINGVNNCFLNVPISNFVGFKHITFKDFNVLVPPFGGLLSFRNTNIWRFQGCLFEDTEVTFTSDASWGDITANTWDITYSSGKVLGLAKNNGHILFRSSNNTDNLETDSGCFLFVAQNNSSVECLETISGSNFQGSLGDVSGNSHISYPASSSSSEDPVFDESGASVTVGTEVFNFDPSSDPNLTQKSIPSALLELSGLVSSGGSYVAKPVITTNSTVWFDPLFGDDSRDGLTSSTSVQTLARVLEILRSYFWGWNNVTISVQDTFTLTKTLDFSGVDGIATLTINGESDLTIGTGSRFVNFRFTLRITDTQLAGTIIATQGNRLDLESSLVATADYAILATLTDVGYFIAQPFSGMSGRTFSTAFSFNRCGEIRVANLLANNLNATTFVSATDVNRIELFGAPSTVSMSSGRVFSIDGIGTKITGFTKVTGVTASAYDPSTDIDGDNAIRGDFLDDTAAATGGVQIGEKYHNAGALRVRLV